MEFFELVLIVFDLGLESGDLGDGVRVRAGVDHGLDLGEVADDRGFDVAGAGGAAADDDAETAGDIYVALAEEIAVHDRVGVEIALTVNAGGLEELAPDIGVGDYAAFVAALHAGLDLDGAARVDIGFFDTAEDSEIALAADAGAGHDIAVYDNVAAEDHIACSHVDVRFDLECVGDAQRVILPELYLTRKVGVVVIAVLGNIEALALQRGLILAGDAGEELILDIVTETALGSGSVGYDLLVLRDGFIHLDIAVIDGAVCLNLGFIVNVGLEMICEKTVSAVDCRLSFCDHMIGIVEFVDDDALDEGLIYTGFNAFFLKELHDILDGIEVGRVLTP